jgi:Sortase domain
MKGLSAPGIVLPLALVVVGAGLMLAGNLPLDPVASLPGIPDETPVAVVTPSPTPRPSGATPGPTPTQTPIPDSWVAVQLQIESVELNVPVKHATAEQSAFPPGDAAYILYQSPEPGRGTNSYIVGHALQLLFKRLWNVVLGAEVKVLMSDGAVLRYVVTEIHPNVSCPDLREALMPNPPLALQYPPPGECPGAVWALPTGHERLTMQTSQGFNRNWGELVVVAEPIP